MFVDAPVKLVGRETHTGDERGGVPISPPRATKTALSQMGTSRAHGATNKWHHVCARRRDGEMPLKVQVKLSPLVSPDANNVSLMSEIVKVSWL